LEKLKERFDIDLKENYRQVSFVPNLLLLNKNYWKKRKILLKKRLYYRLKICFKNYKKIKMIKMST